MSPLTGLMLSGKLKRSCLFPRAVTVGKSHANSVCVQMNVNGDHNSGGIWGRGRAPDGWKELSGRGMVDGMDLGRWTSDNMALCALEKQK